MSRNVLDLAAGGAFMGKTIVEAKDILEIILQNYSRWHTERAPMPYKKVSSIEEVEALSNKMDVILASINKQNVENVPLHELVGNNAESVDVNFVRNLEAMVMVIIITTLIIGHHMFRTSTLLVVMFLVIWKILLDLLYLLKRS
jgi:hypothetical protein